MQATQYCPLSQQSGVPLDYDATDEHWIQVLKQDPIAVPSGQATSLQDILLSRYLTGLGASSITSMHPLIPDTIHSGMVEEQDDMALLEDHFLCQDLADATHPGMVEEQDDMPFVDDYLFRLDLADIKSIVITNHFSFDQNASAQPGDIRSPLFFPSNGTFGYPTSWHTSASPQSPVGPSATGHLSSQDLTDIELQGLFQIPLGGSEHSQAGNFTWPLPTPPRAATSWPIINSSHQSPVGPSAAGHLSNLDLDINPQGRFPFPLGENEHSQAGNVPFITSSEAADSPTSWSIIDSSLQSPVWPSASGHTSSLDLPDINPQDLSHFPFGGNEHSQQSQPGNGQVLSPLVIPSTRAAGPPTSSTTTTQSPVEPSAAGPHVTTEDEIRAVGSLLIQQAAAKRRTSDGIYECPLCNSTLTRPHNLEYHINAHMGLKPYKCSTCRFATAYPTALGPHMKRGCKGTLVIP